MGAYRGWFALDGVEIANSSRVIAHLGADVPTDDTVFGTPAPDGYALVEDPPGSGLYIPGPPMGAEDENADGLYDPGDLIPVGNGLYLAEYAGCHLAESAEYPGYYEIPSSSVEVSEGLWTPPAGARRYGPGLIELDGTCWGPAAICAGCPVVDVDYDDAWPGLREWLGDNTYRPELAPWYTTRQPESGEFAGVWVTRADGFDPTPVDRPIIQLAASGAAAGSNRDMPRTLSFEALLVGCTHAGVEFGLDWLACLLRAAAERDDSVLRYLSASPAHSGVDPDTLVREVHGVVLTKAPVVVQEFNTEKRRNQQATVYVVSWEMTTLSPYPYLPAVEVPVAWDEQTRQPVNYVHSPDCEKPESCIEIPVLFSTECVPEEIEVVTSPPPVCGGCMPVGEIEKYSFWVPTLDWPLRCRETAVTTIIRNLGEDALSLQAFWRECGSDVRCEESLWPLKVAGLAAGAELVLDGVTGRFWAIYKDRRHHVSGVVGTPSGAPWRPPVIDRQTCWELVVQTAANSEFDVHLTLRDREP